MAKARVSDIVVTPYASCLGCLNSDDVYIGTTVIDIGAGCSSIGTFYKNKLVYAGIVNIGGFHISSDIAKGLSTSILAAERLKILHGGSINSNDENDLIDVPLTGSDETTDTHKIHKKELNNIIMSRIQEILENIRSKTDKLIMERNLTSNIILTGKSSELKGFRNLTSDFFGVKTRIGNPISIKGNTEKPGPDEFSVFPFILIGFPILVLTPKKSEVKLRKPFNSDDFPVKIILLVKFLSIINLSVFDLIFSRIS
jgi:cell division protein FtsA